MADKADKVGQAVRVVRAGTRRAVTQAVGRGRPMVAVEATAVVVGGFVAAAARSLVCALRL